MKQTRIRSGRRSGLFLAISALLACHGALAQSAQEPQQPASPPQQAQQQAQDEPTTLDSVVVSSEYIPEPLLQSSSVISVVTQADFERTGDGDAAQALTRVSGLSLVSDKFVYVRGLGERYSSALFNGSPLPSPEPLQRVVPLDLFPSEVLKGVTVQKTYSARYPGEFGGGVIDLQGLTVPEESFLKLSVSGGGNSVTTGENGLTYYGGDDDFWGYDDGSRKMSPELGSALATGKRIAFGDFSREDIRTIGRSFNDPNLYLLQQKNSIDPDVGFGGSAGFASEIQDGVKLGGVAVASFSNEWRTRFGKQQTGYFNGDAIDYIESDYDFASTRNTARVNAMVGVGLKSERHQVGFTTLYVHDTQKESFSRSGDDNLAGFEARDDRTSWFERKLVNSQLSGSHTFGEYSDVIVEWRAAVAKANRDAPYETGIRYENTDGYWAHDASRVQNYFRFSEVEDEVRSAGVDLTWHLPTERSLTLTGGLAWSDNDRSSWTRTFTYLAGGSLPFYNRYQRIDYLFSDYNLSQDLLEIREITGNAGAAAYDANLEVKAAYLQLEGEIVENVRGSLGLRFEDATQAVHPYDIFTGARLDSPDPLENDYLLPAFALTWNAADNQQIRLGASETIARPQFREMAPQQYNDPDNGRLFFGNPYLVDSKLRNFDVRYERYFEQGEYFTAGLFYKQIDKPIEALVSSSSAGIVQSFINAPEATLFGFELEFKKYFDLGVDASWWGDKRLYLATNYTWTDSEVNATDSDTVWPYGFVEPQPATLFVEDGSQMQGQSEHIGNLQLGIESADSGLQATLIANYVSERISARGEFGQPNYIEEPGTTLDFVLRKSFDLGIGDKATLSFSARNLLGTEHQEYQKGGGNRIDVYTYDPGISYNLGISLEF